MFQENGTIGFHHLKSKKTTVNLMKVIKLPLIMLNQTPRLESTKAVLDNLPITVTTHTQHLMLSEISSPIQTLVLANGGKFNSARNTGLLKSRFSTEEIAAEIDSREPRYSLTTNSVDQFQEVLKTVSGTKSDAQAHYLVRK